MSVPNLSQLQSETDTWKRLLGFLMDENNRLKLRLSELIHGTADEQLLARAEQFQNSFVREDQLIQLLRNEIAELNILLQQKKNGEPLITETGSRLQKLRKSILYTENGFYKLMIAFNMYLFEYR